MSYIYNMLFKILYYRVSLWVFVYACVYTDMFKALISISSRDHVFFLYSFYNF